MELNIPMNTRGALSLSELGGANGGTAPAAPAGTVQPQPGAFSPTPQPAPGPGAPQTFPAAAAPQPARVPPQGGRGLILKKGQKQSLSRLNANLNLIQVGIGWDLNANGAAYDLDVEAFLLNDRGACIDENHLVFYNQMTSPDGAVRLLGDNTTGAGDGDDEIIQVQLNRLSPQVSRIVFVVTINEALERGYNFGNVRSAYARIVDCSNGQELLRFDLTENYPTVTSMTIGELYQRAGEWRFNAIGNGLQTDLEGLCRFYGLQVAG